ncbi:hypothetical protein H70737_11730 [Paenibacillus sp. FSL H7-0737]|nr:hypothetical protein H70737_11730 [Paenibacillus sp. FSL H7-0737]
MALPNCCNDPSQFKATLSFLSILNGKRCGGFCQNKLKEKIRVYLKQIHTHSTIKSPRNTILWAQDSKALKQTMLKLVKTDKKLLRMDADNASSE